jgi:hypothetical protein
VKSSSWSQLWTSLFYWTKHFSRVRKLLCFPDFWISLFNWTKFFTCFMSCFFFHVFFGGFFSRVFSLFNWTKFFHVFFLFCFFFFSCEEIVSHFWLANAHCQTNFRISKSIWKTQCLYYNKSFYDSVEFMVYTIIYPMSSLHERCKWAAYRQRNKFSPLYFILQGTDGGTIFHRFRLSSPNRPYVVLKSTTGDGLYLSSDGAGTMKLKSWNLPEGRSPPGASGKIDPAFLFRLVRPS